MNSLQTPRPQPPPSLVVPITAHIIPRKPRRAAIPETTSLKTTAIFINQRFRFLIFWITVMASRMNDREKVMQKGKTVYRDLTFLKIATRVKIRVTKWMKIDTLKMSFSFEKCFVVSGLMEDIVVL